MSDDDVNQTSTILFRHEDPIVELKAFLGEVDYHIFHDNMFLALKLIARKLPVIKEKIEQSVIKVPKDYIFPTIIEKRIDAIWNGGCKYAYKDDSALDDWRTFCYHYPFKPEDYVDIIDLPKYKNMIPVNKLKDDNLLVQIRERLPMVVAFETSDWATIVSEGGFTYETSEGIKKKIQREDLESWTIFVNYASKHVYHALMDDFDLFFMKCWAKVDTSLSKILDQSDFDGNFEETTPAQMFTPMEIPSDEF